MHQALLHPTAPSDIISGNRARMAMPASMIHMNDAELWGSLLDDPRMRQLAEVIDQNAEAASGYQADDHEQARHPKCAKRAGRGGYDARPT